jgi:NAD(P)-dependent dehydrogenase (short-subunit alcohol dehydrogenase family)
MGQYLAGRVAVVTGANRGIGFETCRQLALFGARVVLGSRDVTKGVTAQETLRSEGLDVTAHQLDVTSPTSVDALATWLKAEYGQLDILVNNAGIMPNKKRVLEASLEEVEEMWQVNLVGAWRTTLALLPLMQAGGWGRIVNVSSQAGSLATTNAVATAYRVSKTALNTFTKSLAEELRPQGILANAVCPGWVASDMGGPEATRTLEQGAASILWAVALPDEGPSGGFFQDGKPLPW